MFEYTLKRSKRRKTVAIKVAEQQLTVYAPHFVPRKDIEAWLKTKQHWVAEQVTKQSLHAEQCQFPIKNSQIKLFDQVIPLVFKQENCSQWYQDTDTHELTLAISPRVKLTDVKYLALMEEFLHDKLETYLEMRIQNYCIQMREALPTRLKIQHYKRRWGSCNRQRELTFNLHLASAPLWVIDYVVVHELAHLKHMDHSAAFWQRVSEFYPEHKKASNWLKVNGPFLRWL